MDSIISFGQKNTLAEYMILSGADNRPPMLDKDLYDSWKSQMEIYMQNREHGRMILESVEHGPLIWPTVEENGVIKTKKYVELSAAEKIQADCDMKATNIILQGLPANIYSLVNHHRVAKDLWERVQLLMQGTSLTKQERACKLYDVFDKFTHIKGESIHTYCLRFTQLINDMNIYKMKMEQFQVNTRFLNSLPPEWSKFVTDVKLVKDLHTSNFDQLHAYLEQHELYANEVRFDVLVFSPEDDPIACLNKAMAFLTAVAPSRGDKGKIILVLRIRAMLQGQGEILQVDWRELLNATNAKTKDLNTYDSDCDDLSTAQAVLMANISNYGSDIISEVPNSETYLNDIDNQEKLYLLHMDLCGPMRVASINGKIYILVIARRLLKIYLTLREWYENVGITHQTSVARTPQQNGVVERRNQTLVEAARTMLIFSKAPLFLWAEAINTACYTQNRSLICHRYNKTPYELMQDKKPDLSFLHVFGSLCYPTNDHEDLGKFDAKADIGIFVGYAPAKKAFRIYNRRTQIISETIHVTFDELTAMASKQFSSGPGLHYMTPAASNTGLISNPVSQQPCIPPIRDDWDRLFQPIFDEYFNPPTIVVSSVQEADAPRAEVLADSPVSTSIDQDAP
ncbi:retrovirus-related pol polyprotein from transposon TNT 1-94 [Tanacetum coccineum]